MPLPLRRWRRYVHEYLGLEPRLRPGLVVPVEIHGVGYGAWAVVSSRLTVDSVVYSFGIGVDTSFEESLLAAYGCRIFAHDPTPRSVSWVQGRWQDPRLEFQAVALADHDGTLKLFLPENDRHVSASLVRSGRMSDRFFEAPCARLSSLMAMRGHQRIDVLKMDIEGAEYPVIEELARSAVLARVEQVLVEVHHWLPGFSVRQTRRAVGRFREAGFEIAWTSDSGHELLFARAGQP